MPSGFVRWGIGCAALIAACGDDGAAPPRDAKTPDDAASHDAAPPDGPSTTISVIARNRCCTGEGNLTESVAVLVHDAGGALTGTATTGADGRASPEIEAGGILTAVYPTTGSGTDLVTVFGAGPGEQLFLGEAFDNVTEGLDNTGTVSWTAQGSGVTSYLVNTGCEAFITTETSTPIEVFVDCGTPTTDILVVGRSGTTPLRWSLFENAEVTEGASIIMPAFQDAGTLAIDVTGIPAEVVQVQASATPIIGTAEGQIVQVSGAPVAGGISTTGAWSASTGAAFRVDLEDAIGRHQLQYRMLAPEETLATLAAPALLPWISGAAADVKTRTVSWTESSTGGADAVVVTLRWGEPAAHGGSEHSWTLIAPPGTSVTWPALPAPHDVHMPTPADDVVVEVRLVDVEVFDGYAAVRALPEPLLVQATETAALNVLPVRIATTSTGSL
jgi:hypothetical protein